MPSDTEEEDDDDPDGMLEADLDKDEIIQPQDVDHVGDEFLRLHYSTTAANTTQRKKRVCLQVVVVVVVIAQQLFSNHQLSRLRKSVTSHKSCTVSCVGWLWQLNRCSTECGATPHSGQTSDMPLVMRALFKSRQ